MTMMMSDYGTEMPVASRPAVLKPGQHDRVWCGEKAPEPEEKTLDLAWKKIELTQETSPEAGWLKFFGGTLSIFGLVFLWAWVMGSGFLALAFGAFPFLGFGVGMYLLGAHVAKIQRQETSCRKF